MVNWHSQCSWCDTSHSMYFLWNNCLLYSFIH